MPSIAEATGARRRRERRRLLLGLGLLGLGALFVGLGAAGTVSGASGKAGLVAGGLAVLVSLAALTVRADLAERERTLGSVGIAVAAASLLLVWALAPAAVLSRPALAIAGALGYLSGVAVLVAAVLAGVTLDRPSPGRHRQSRGVAWTRDDSSRTPAADGGERDKELSSPLDED